MILSQDWGLFVRPDEFEETLVAVERRFVCVFINITISAYFILNHNGIYPYWLIY